MNNLLLIMTALSAFDSGCLGLLIFHNRTLLYHQAVLACAQDKGSLWDCTEDEDILHMMHGCVGKYWRFWVRSHGSGINACQFNLFGFHCTKEFEYSHFLPYFCNIQSDTDATSRPDHVLCDSDNRPTTSSALPPTHMSSSLHPSTSTNEPSSASFTLTSFPDDVMHTSVTSLTKNTSFATSNSTHFSINGSDGMPLAIMVETADDKGWIVAAVICPLIVVTLILLCLIWRRFSTEFAKSRENVYVNTSKVISHKKPRFSASDIVIIRDHINDENTDIRSPRVTFDNSKRGSDCKIPEDTLTGTSEHYEKETIYCNIDDVYLEPIQLFHRDSKADIEVMKTDDSKRNFATENVEESDHFEYSLASAPRLDIESQYVNQDLYSEEKTSTEKIRSDENEEAVYAVCDMDIYHHLCKDNERKSQNDRTSQMYSKARNPDNMDAVDDSYDHISAEKIAEDAQFALPDFEKEADC